MMEIIENIHPNDEIEGSIERFALNLYEKNKTQEFLKLTPSDFVWKQRGYLSLLTDKPHLFNLCQDPNFLVFVGKPGFPIPTTLHKTMNVTQIYPLEHANDPDFCLKYTNFHAFDAERDSSFENHFPEIPDLPLTELNNVCPVVIIHKNSAKSTSDAIDLRNRWFSFLKQLSTILKTPQTFGEYKRRQRQLKSRPATKGQYKATRKTLVSLLDAKRNDYCKHCKLKLRSIFPCSLCGKTKCSKCSLLAYSSSSGSTFSKLQICKDCYIEKL
jgi:hypothetical protein